MSVLYEVELRNECSFQMKNVFDSQTQELDEIQAKHKKLLSDKKLLEVDKASIEEEMEQVSCHGCITHGLIYNDEGLLEKHRKGLALCRCRNNSMSANECACVRICVCGWVVLSLE